MTVAAEGCSRAVVERMTEVMAHRGPDGFGYYQDSHVWLAHRRLSIVDLTGGGQPMPDEDGSLQVTYNGEVFNHGDLRKGLEQAGHRYRSHCDTETILHAYEEYGPGSLEHYRGMFAFAIWDRRKKELFCARDRLGIKPFYYFHDGKSLVFGSEIKVLLEHPDVRARLEESTLGEYFAFGYNSGEQTMFRGIRQLMPGHWMRVRAKDGRLDLEIQRYWDAPHESTVSGASEEELIADCRRRLEETVRLRLMSDVPLGMFLSGGVDSSAIAALILKLRSGPLQTFSVGYREAEYSELSYAAEVARHLGTEHREVSIGAGEFFDVLPELIWHEDEPITWPSSVSLYFVSKLAAQHVKVVLTGEGSDELFGGYSRYGFYLRMERWMRAYGVVPGFVRAAMRGFVAESNLLSGSVRRKLQHTFLGREGGIESLYLDNFYSAISRSEQTQLLRGAAAGTPYESFLRYYQTSQASPLARLLYADQKTYLVELLRKQDRMSMACSIESRVPFLDHHFVAFAHSVPDGLKQRNGEGKYILKRAVEDLLPRSIIYRTKMGFPTPLRQWLMEDAGRQVREVLLDRNGILAQYTNRAEMENLLRLHQAGSIDATDRMWRLVNFQLWGDVYLTGRRTRGQRGLLTPVEA